MINYVYRKPLVRSLVGLYDAAGYLLARAPRPIIKPPQQISLLILNQIGDFILTSSTVKTLQASFPQAQHTIITTKINQSLSGLFLPGVEVKTFNPDWQRAVRQSDQSETADQSLNQLLQQAQPDLVVIFHPDLKVNKLVRASCKAAVTVGFNNAGGGFNLTHPVAFPAQGHQLKRLASLAERVGQIYNQPIAAPQPPQLTLSPTLRQAIQVKLAASQLELSKLVVLHPFGRYPTKNWTEDGWRQLIDWLVSHQYQPLLIGTAAEQNQPFYRPTGLTDWCGQLSLPETAGVLALARLFIGIDSGPAHLAAAAGTPVVSIYSTVNDPAQWQPRGRPDQVKVLAAEPSQPERFPKETRNLPAGVEDNPYTSGISWQMVRTATEQLLANRSR